MSTKKRSIILSLLPTVAALGLMYKMSLDQQVEQQEHVEALAEMKERARGYEGLEGDLSRYCTSLDTCPEEIDQYITKLKEAHRSLENTIDQTSTASSLKDNEIASLRTKLAEARKELSRTEESLKLTKQTVDTQISIEMAEVNERIDEIHESYRDTISQLKEQLQLAQQQAQQEVSKKEAQFKEIHKKSVNNLLGMVDSLAKERETRLIPLISLYDDQTVHDNYICRDSDELRPSEMIFSKHMDRHWLTWPVTVIENSSGSLSARTQNGYILNASWENPENMYDLEEDDSLSIQFMLDKDQSCDKTITARRAVITTH